MNGRKSQANHRWMRGPTSRPPDARARCSAPASASGQQDAGGEDVPVDEAERQHRLEVQAGRRLVEAEPLRGLLEGDAREQRHDGHDDGVADEDPGEGGVGRGGGGVGSCMGRIAPGWTKGPRSRSVDVRKNIWTACFPCRYLPRMKTLAILLCALLLLPFALPARASAGDAAPRPRHRRNGRGRRSFKTLAAALTAAGLVDALKGAGPFTVFAPTDDAFAKLPDGTVEGLLKPGARAQLTAILTYHVVPGRVLSTDLLGASSAKTLEGRPLAIGLGSATPTS